MLRGQLLRWCILLITLAKYTSSFEVLIKTTLADDDQTSEKWQDFKNKSYEIPLFQKRYVTIRTQLNDIQSKRFNRSVVGFKFHVSSINAVVADVRKELTPLTTPTESINDPAILLEDLYIGKYWST